MGQNAFGIGEYLRWRLAPDVEGSQQPARVSELLHLKNEVSGTMR